MNDMRFALLIVVCLTSPATAQVAHELDVVRAKGFSLAEVIADQRNAEKLEITEDQWVRIDSIREAYAKHSNELLTAAYGVEPGGHISGNILEIAKRMAPMQKEIKEQDKEYETQLMKELNPKQIEKAYGLLVQERYGIGGIQAVVESDDTPYVTNAFSRPLGEVRRSINDSADEVEKEIAKLEAELRKIIEQYQKKAQEIKREGLEKALDKLGSDGDILSALISLDQ